MELVLAADPTRASGTRSSRRLRREGRVPAVVYGLGGEPVAVSVSWRELRQCLKTEAGANAVITLDVEGSRHLCILKEIQRHPVRREVIHADFLRVDPKKTVTVEVPVALVGEAKKVAAMQGIVDQQLFKIAVDARPDAIPNEITIDVSELEIGLAITVAEIQLPPGVTAATDAGAIIVHGSATRSTVMMQSDTEPAKEPTAESAAAG